MELSVAEFSSVHPLSVVVVECTGAMVLSVAEFAVVHQHTVVGKSVLGIHLRCCRVGGVVEWGVVEWGVVEWGVV